MPIRLIPPLKQEKINSSKPFSSNVVEESTPRSESVVTSTTTKEKEKPVIHINIGEVGTYAKIGQLQPTYAFNLDIATRRSAKDIARDRLYDTGFPRVTRGYEPDAEMVESARRAVSARGSGRDTAVNNANVSSRELAKELDVVSGGGGFNLSLLSSSRYYHSAQSTMSGQSEFTKKSPRNTARKFIQQETQLPYGREAFDDVSDTKDSLYGADFSRRYKLNDPQRYNSSIEVLKNENRPFLKNITPSTAARCEGGLGRSELPPPPKYLTQTPRGKLQMTEIMTKLPKKETAAIAGGYI